MAASRVSRGRRSNLFPARFFVTSLYQFDALVLERRVFAPGTRVVGSGGGGGMVGGPGENFPYAVMRAMVKTKK